MAESPPVLNYGDTITSRGVSCQTTSDGVRIVVPYRDGFDRFVQESPAARPFLFAGQTVLNVLMLPFSVLSGVPLWLNRIRFTPAVEVEVTREELIVTDRRDDCSVTGRWAPERCRRVPPEPIRQNDVGPRAGREQPGRARGIGF